MMKQGHFQTSYISRLMLEPVVLVQYVPGLFSQVRLAF